MMKLLYMGIVGAVLAMSGQVCSATDGTLGTTSSGNILIDMNVVSAPESEIQITGLSDLDFGDVILGETLAPLTLDGICVYMSTAATYSIAIHYDDYGLSVGFSEWSVDLEFTDANGTVVTTRRTPDTYSLGEMSGLQGSSTDGCNSADLASFKVIPGPVPSFLYGRTGLEYFRTTFVVTPD